MLHLGAVSSRFVTFKQTLKCWLCAAPRNEGIWESHSRFWPLFHTIDGPTAPRWSSHHSYPGSNLQGTKTPWKCQVHVADSSLTGSSCSGCHPRVTLPSAVPEDRVSPQQAQGNLGSQDLGSRTADPSGRQCHTTAGGMEASSLELGTCLFHSCDNSRNSFLKGLCVLQENLELQEKRGREGCRQHHH